ncbi:protein translocase subunit SecF [Candidatus Acetothermia bacterium]|nr:protein translocase subunit SecF [Candidatus Acetothermia bacterium]MBI3460781.1 protein translocase subunit SecF [Candidatus Acetothermia bacterium]
MFQIIWKETHIDFMGKRFIAFTLSGLLVLAGIFAFIQISLGNANLGIEFVGGTAMQISFSKPVPLDQARGAIRGTGITGEELQNIEGKNAIFVRVKRVDIGTNPEETAEKRITDALRKLDDKLTIDSSESIGPTIGKELRDKAILAIIFATLGLLIYIAIRFDYKFGIAAAIATFHDVLAVLGVVYILNIEITLFIITALLTLAGYSLTDTVVVFDRIRENLRKNPRMPFMDLLNASINQVLSRTIITSLTVLLVLVALFFFGGTVLHDFSFALGFGVIVGTYSSIFVASPLLLIWRGGGSGKLIGQVKREQPTAAATSKP